MMMDYLGRKNNDDDLVAVGRLIDESVADHLKEGKMLTYDIGGNGLVLRRRYQHRQPTCDQVKER